MDMGISLGEKDYNFYFLKKYMKSIALGRVYCVKKMQ